MPRFRAHARTTAVKPRARARLPEGKKACARAKVAACSLQAARKPASAKQERPPQEPQQARAGMSGIEAAAPVVGRSPAARAARGGTEGRRGHQKRKARAKPEPLEKPRSSWPQRVSAVRGKMRQHRHPKGRDPSGARWSEAGTRSP